MIKLVIFYSHVSCDPACRLPSNCALCPKTLALPPMSHPLTFPAPPISHPLTSLHPCDHRPTSPLRRRRCLVDGNAGDDRQVRNRRQLRRHLRVQRGAAANRDPLAGHGDRLLLRRARSRLLPADPGAGRCSFCRFWRWSVAAQGGFCATAAFILFSLTSDGAFYPIYGRAPAPPPVNAICLVVCLLSYIIRV